jgi:hypothetical protein
MLGTEEKHKFPKILSCVYLNKVRLEPTNAAKPRLHPNSKLQKHIIPPITSLAKKLVQNRISPEPRASSQLRLSVMQDSVQKEDNDISFRSLNNIEALLKT